MSGHLTEAAAVSVVATILTLAIAAPVLRAPADRIFGMETVGRHHDPFTAMEQFGRPITTRTYGVYSQPLTDIPGAMLARVFGQVAAYNWLVLLTFPLSAAAAYLLARHLTLSPAGAAFAAIAFAFSPFHLAHAAYHPQIAQTQWIPLYLFALWRCLDDATAAAVSLLLASTIAVTLSNFYGGLIAAVLTPVAIAAYFLFKTRTQRVSLRHLAITIGVLVAIGAGGLAYASYTAHAVVVHPAAFGFARGDLFRYSAKWWSYLVPPVAHPILGGIARRVWSAAGMQAAVLEQQVSLGWGVVMLGLVAVAAWGRHGQTPGQHRATASVSVAAVPILAVVALAALVCSLSPERTLGPFTFVRPSAILYRVVPMFRAYARFGVVVQLMAALLAGIGVERLWRGGRRQARLVCVALLMLAAWEYTNWPSALWRDVLPTMAHRWVMQQPGGLQVLDCAPLTPESESVAWLTAYRVSLSSRSFDDCMEPNLAEKLSAAGYTHLLVRRDSSEGRWFASGRAQEGLRVVARFGDGAVLAVTSPPPLVYTASMTGFYSREHDEASTWRWMGPPASWDIVNKTARPIVATVDVEMTAFHHSRRVKILLDGLEVQTLMVQEHLGTTRIGPLDLTPGGHALMFCPDENPTVANDAVGNGDRRPLSFAFGTWRWTVPDERP